MMKEQRNHISVLHDVRGSELACRMKTAGTGAKN